MGLCTYLVGASLLAYKVKNLSAMQEIQVQCPGQESPLEKGMTIHSSVLAWKNPLDGGAWQVTVHVVAESDMTE